MNRDLSNFSVWSSSVCFSFEMEQPRRQVYIVIRLYYKSKSKHGYVMLSLYVLDFGFYPETPAGLEWRR
jgi:hypothetical protein